MVDPVNPGAVDEILNLGTALDSKYLEKNKSKIISISKEISQYFKRAYMYMDSAKGVHDDWCMLNSKAIDNVKSHKFIDTLKDKIFRLPKHLLYLLQMYIHDVPNSHLFLLKL